VTEELRRRLMHRTAELLRVRLKTNAALRLAQDSGLGLCFDTTECGARACEELGVRYRIRSGRVLYRYGRMISPHTWLELLPGHEVLDCPQPGELVLGTPRERGDQFWAAP
jgi:hypothetical protein